MRRQIIERSGITGKYSDLHHLGCIQVLLIIFATSVFFYDYHVDDDDEDSDAPPLLGL